MIIERPLVINQPQIGKLIREARLGTGLTQEKFAVKLGVTYPTINRWDNGHTKPSPLAMQKIEDMLKHRDLYGKNLNS
jgi:putative transcriptional regulator